MHATGKPNNSLAGDLIVYVCILALAGLQILIAYGHADVRQLFVRMVVVAFVQAGLAVLFFMHMRLERRVLGFSLGLYTIFVLFMMNMIWSDSFRLLHMRPFAK
jgi:cytochrome c oxidase subunit IV